MHSCNLFCMKNELHAPFHMYRQIIIKGLETYIFFILYMCHTGKTELLQHK